MRSASNSKLGVCMIAVYFYPDVGGIQMTLLSLSQYLQKMGVEVTVITRRTHDDPYYEDLDGIRVFRLDIPKSTPKVKAALQFIFGALKLLWDERSRYQIIHSHQLVTPTTIGLLAKTLLDKKLVLTPHTPKTAGAFHSLVYKRPFTGKPRIKWMQKSANAMVAISKEIQDDLLELNFSKNKITYIPNGVDTRRFSPLAEEEKPRQRKELGLPDGPIITCAGRLIERKQIDVLIQAFSMLVPDLPPTASLVVLGDGEERVRLEALAASLNISEQVHFLGAVLDTAKYLRTSDLFVIPSSIEGMPIILLEAMACGLTCVGSKIGGIEELIHDEETGLFTISGDAVDLKEKIQTLLNDESLSYKLGRAAREEIEEYYSMDATAKAHLDLYESLLNLPL